MNKKEQTFYNAQKTFSQKGLSSEQKKAMLSHIYQKVPVEAYTQTSVESPSTQSILSPFFIFFKKNSFKVATVASVLVMVTLTHASANSLPGDVLYKVKVDIIEPIISATKSTEDARIEYTLFLLNKRIEELEILHARGIKDQKRVEQNSQVVQRTIQILQDNGIINDEKILMAVAQKIEVYNKITGLQLQIQNKLHDRINQEGFKDTHTKPTSDNQGDIPNQNALENRIEALKSDVQNTASSSDSIRQVIEDETDAVLKDTGAPQEIKEDIKNIIKNLEL